ncbi:hypothetical protein [Novipirellula artificiosorum]|nr:hypothetical protein [Novipirellula artificiosorum]
MATTSAQERRAKPPTFDATDTQGVFFPSLEEALRGQRPTWSSVRQSSQDAAEASVQPNNSVPSDDPNGAFGWNTILSAASIEDEVKRLKLHFDSVVTTPGAFNGGGFQDARLDLSILATLFAVIDEYSGDVRWKDQAATARDLIARTAFNCKAGSTQVYNEAKMRKADLQDLVAGSGLASRASDPETDWSMVVDRSPLMQYAEQLAEKLKSASRDVASAEQNAEHIRRNAQLLAMVGKVLTREGLDEADDPDYAALSLNMTRAAVAVAEAIDRGSYELGNEVGAVTQSCDACHEQYR